MFLAQVVPGKHNRVMLSAAELSPDHEILPWSGNLPGLRPVACVTDFCFDLVDVGGTMVDSRCRHARHVEIIEMPVVREEYSHPVW
jgi:hypothetical protein